jgi:hypothetical protein
MDSVVSLPNRSELRRFVRQVLSDHDRLDASQYPFFESPITRRERVCGLLFELQGPRLMRSRAIWAGDEHRILFYDTTGNRFAEVQLSEAPDPSIIQAELDHTRSEPQVALAVVAPAQSVAEDDHPVAPTSA